MDAITSSKIQALVVQSSKGNGKNPSNKPKVESTSKMSHHLRRRIQSTHKPHHLHSLERRLTNLKINSIVLFVDYKIM